MKNNKINQVVKSYADLVLSCDDFVKTFLNDTKISADQNKKMEFYISTLLFLRSYEQYSCQSLSATKKFYLKKIIHLMKNTTLSMNAFNGLIGIGYAIHFSKTDDEKSFALLESKFDNIFLKILYDYKTNLLEAINKAGLFEADYDLIDGYAAIVGFLINSGIYNKNYNLFESITADFISVLNTKPWIIQSFNMILPYLTNEFPYGATNFSLSHGMAGPLSVLALLKSKELNFENEALIINKIVNLYKKNIVINGSKAWWPTRKAAKSKSICNFPRASWCYGTPGIANALFNASIVTNDDNLKEMVIESIFTLSKMAFSDLHIDSMTICHGLSGLILCTNNINKKLKNDELKERQNFYVDILLENAESNYKYIYHNYDYSMPFKPNSSKACQDDISFLTGSTGVMMTLMAIESNIEFNWFKILSLY